MTRDERAVAFHGQGLNCAQSVLLALEDYTGLSPEIAQKVASGFGGGVRSGEICGCVTGGVMALGMRTAQSETAELTKELVAAFADEHGCVRCADLQKKYGGKTNCENMIAASPDMTIKVFSAHGIEPKKG